MHVIIIFILLILLCYLIMNWQISLPVLLFLIYLAVTFLGDTKKRHHFRFHALWWLFLLSVAGGIFYREELKTFTYRLDYEYSQYFDRVIDRGVSRVPPSDAAYRSLNDSLRAEDGLRIFGSLEVGMSPFEVVWRISEMGEMNDFHIRGVRLDDFSRSYFDNRLYGISLSFADSKDYADADTLVSFFEEKYGKTHHLVRKDSLFQAEWRFDYKHIVVETKQTRYGYKGALYIYHPEKLAEKIAEKHQKEKERAEELQQMIEERKEKERQEKQRLQEKLDELEEKNRMLQQSL